MYKGANILLLQNFLNLLYSFYFMIRLNYKNFFQDFILSLNVVFNLVAGNRINPGRLNYNYISIVTTIKKLVP